jgi:hypothetical protein
MTARTPIAPTAAARMRSAAIIIRRRSIRSVSTPPKTIRTSCGTTHAMPTNDIAVGRLSSSSTCQAIAT